MYQYKDRDTATCNRIECPKMNSHIHRSVDFQQRCQIHSTEKGGTFQKWCWKNDDGGLVTKFCPTLVTPWTVARQAPLFMGFPRQEYWSRLPFPSPGDLPDSGIEPTSPALADGFFMTELP